MQVDLKITIHTSVVNLVGLSGDLESTAVNYNHIYTDKLCFQKCLGSQHAYSVSLKSYDE
jgi:hypothetical protein